LTQERLAFKHPVFVDIGIKNDPNLRCVHGKYARKAKKELERADEVEVWRE
jgi:hypothetical protein